MGTVAVGREDSLHPPTQLHCIRCPFLVSQLGGTASKLSEIIDIPEEKFVGPTDTLHKPSILGPVQLSNEGLVAFEGALEFITLAIYVINVYSVVVRSHC